MAATGHLLLRTTAEAEDWPDWRPDEFGYGGWGFRTHIRYGVAKLLDHAEEPARLESDPNPFAAVVLAHLQTLCGSQSC